MCDGGSHAGPLYQLQLDPRENIPNMCLDVYVILGGRWEQLHPGRPAFVDWLVCEFFRGGHTVVMPA